MRSSRVTSLGIIAGLIVGGLTLDAADRSSSDPGASASRAPNGAIPTAAPAGTLSSTWYCAGGTATPDGFADHVILLANASEVDRQATVTVLPGDIAPAIPSAADEVAGETTTTTEAATTTSSEPVAPTTLAVPAWSRVEVRLQDLVDAPLAGAIVELDGGEVAVEHQITGDGGRATAPCSSSAADQWSFPWGITSRGARELFVFMNPFPDDATVSIDFATDEGTRDTLRFRNFVVPGRSVVGAYIDEEVRRKAQVSALVHVGSGRLVVDRIQVFDGTDPQYEGLTLGLGAPTAAEVWIFPDGIVDEGVTEQVVVFNSTEDVAEVEVEARLDDPETNGVPEPFEVTVRPGGYSLVDLHEPDVDVSTGTPRRIPDGVGHSVIVRSLNGVPVTAERVITASAPSADLGVSATFGSPLAAPTWTVAGGGVSAEREEYLTVFNPSLEDIVAVDVAAFADGRTVAVAGLQNVEVPAGGRRSIRLSDHTQQEVLALWVTADGPIVVERGLYRVGGRGISQAMGIPVAAGVRVPGPLDL